MEHLNRYRRVWAFFRWALGPWLKHKFHYTPELCDAEGTYLVLANHNTDWDPLLLALAFPDFSGDFSGFCGDTRRYTAPNSPIPRILSRTDR